MLAEEDAQLDAEHTPLLDTHLLGGTYIILCVVLARHVN